MARSSLAGFMRILLFTGKGGVGKTTVAAATAVRASRLGLRTVICSTDPAHSLADVFSTPLGDAVVPIGPGLDGVQLDARRRLEESWGSVREYLVALLDWAGAGTVEAEELAVIPGLDEVFALADIKAFADSGDYDLVVVDCAPTAETLRLLSLPDVLGWYMQRIFPAQRNLTRAIRPLLARVVNMPLAGDGVFDAVREFYARLDGVRELLTDGSVTSARLVVNAERMVVAEARRTYTYLSLFGYHVDAVIANRLLPAEVVDPWFKGWKELQAEQLEEIEAAFAPVPVLTAELAAEELLGPDRLEVFATAVYGVSDPAAAPHRHRAVPGRGGRDRAGALDAPPVHREARSRAGAPQRRAVGGGRAPPPGHRAAGQPGAPRGRRRPARR